MVKLGKVAGGVEEERSGKGKVHCSWFDFQ